PEVGLLDLLLEALGDGARAGDRRVVAHAVLLARTARRRRSNRRQVLDEDLGPRAGAQPGGGEAGDELARLAAERPAAERLGGARGERLRLAALGGEALEDRGRELGHVLAALGERRQLDAVARREEGVELGRDGPARRGDDARRDGRAGDEEGVDD